jgi:hypothetical protein
MAKSPEELEKMFSEQQNQITSMKKDFELKLESANKNAKEWEEQARTREEDLRKFQEESKKREAEQKEAAAKSSAAEISSFVEAQVKAGRIIPALKEKFVAFMKSLTSEGAVLEFTEANGAKLSHSQISLFKEIISKLKPVVPVAQEYSISGKQTEELPGEAEEPQEQQFMQIRHEGVQKSVPVDDADLASKCYKYMEDNKCDYGTALIALSSRNKVAKA